MNLSILVEVGDFLNAGIEGGYRGSRLRRKRSRAGTARLPGATSFDVVLNGGRFETRIPV